MANPMIFIVLQLISCLYYVPSASSSSSNHTDLLALLAFKSSLHPLNLNSWNETSHFCSWIGISCNLHNRVVGIDLPSSGLAGSLAPHIANLSFLRTINLENNALNGQIPPQLCFLKRLEFLRLGRNSFVGMVPRNLSQCSSLAHLDLNENRLTGIMPLDIGSLRKLQVLNLSRNTLSGPIPSSIGNLTSLTKLSLSYNGFSGKIPESFSRLQSLVVLQLIGIGFSGSIPTGVFNLSSIDTFEVASCGLEGTIPENIGATLPNLRWFLLQENRFRGAFPVSLTNSTILERIGLLNNEFTGPIPIEIGRLSTLRVLMITSNQFDGDIGFLSSLTNCTNLQFLGLDDNMFSGLLPHSIANLSTQLLLMTIDNNRIHGDISSGIGHLQRITRLTMSGNYLEGSIPPTIGNLTKLQDLDLGGNRFTNEIPSSLENLIMLNSLSLGRNQLQGSVPPSLFTFVQLTSLDLSSNNLNGSIPREIRHASPLTYLDLSRNTLTGSIPSEVGFLVNLGNLDLSNNRLSGLIPPSLKYCSVLQRLRLGGNSFHGEIPSELSSLTGLQELDLSRNGLSGPIPMFLSMLHLDYLNLSFNNLQGEVPISGVFRNKSRIFLEGNKELCGGITDLRLPSCSNSKNSSKKLKVLILVLVLGIICAAFSICFIRFILRKKNTGKKSVSSGPGSFLGEQFMRLSYADLSKATNGFSDDNLVGVGTFGSVYKGYLNDKMPFIAVKVLNLSVEGASKSFMAECIALRSIRHRNLLKILSICDSIDFRGDVFKALVYEFKANGSLEEWLHPNAEPEQDTLKKSNSELEFKNLDFMQRLKIAIDVAHALEYLHWGTDSIIVHGDLKPSNILLDQDMTAYVGDFGLAKIISTVFSMHESSTSFRIQGTIGYLPPEYGTSLVVSTQGDVYSYGILLLEMFTKTRPTSNMLEDHVNLHNYVSKALPDRVMEIIDPFVQDREGGDFKIKNCVTSVLRTGVACSREMPANRMSMIQVVQELHKIQHLLLSE